MSRRLAVSLFSLFQPHGGAARVMQSTKRSVLARRISALFIFQTLGVIVNKKKI